MHQKKKIKREEGKTDIEAMQDRLETASRELGIERRLRSLEEEKNLIAAERHKNLQEENALYKLKIKGLQAEVSDWQCGRIKLGTGPLTQCQVCMEEDVPVAWSCKTCSMNLCLLCVKKIDTDNFKKEVSCAPTCPNLACQERLHDSDTLVSSACKAYLQDSQQFRAEALITKESYEVQISKAKEESRIHRVYPNEIFELTEKILNLCCPGCSAPLVLGDGCLKVMCERCDLPTCLYCCHQGFDSSEAEVDGVYKHMHSSCPINPFKETDLSYNCPPCAFDHVIAYSKAYKLYEAFVNSSLPQYGAINYDSRFYKGSLDRLFVTLRGRYAKDPFVSFADRKAAADFGTCPFDWIAFSENPVDDEVEPLLLKPHMKKFNISEDAEVKMVPNPLAEDKSDETDLVPLTMTFVPTTIKHSHMKDSYIPNRKRLQKIGMLNNKKYLQKIDLMEKSDQHFGYGKSFERRWAESRAGKLHDVYLQKRLESEGLERERQRSYWIRCGHCHDRLGSNCAECDYCDHKMTEAAANML